MPTPRLERHDVYVNRGEAERDFTSNDVLSMALARTQHAYFVGDEFAWMQAVEEGIEAIRTSNPDLLGDVYFPDQDLGNGRVWSDEVDGILTTWRRSSILTPLSSRYQMKHIEPDSKRQIIEGTAAVLAPYEEEITVIAGILDSRLGRDK